MFYRFSWMCCADLLCAPLHGQGPAAGHRCAPLHCKSLVGVPCRSPLRAFAWERICHFSQMCSVSKRLPPCRYFYCTSWDLRAPLMRASLHLMQVLGRQCRLLWQCMALAASSCMCGGVCEGFDGCIAWHYASHASSGSNF